ncbi:unnamed protein product [Clavelina lepadiformis]|uniref:G-protein coupled receptors family 1 profile domain-containing protein n=1 Tax=Clavelina lepadiformis TaxID=159417 RepID=A0ABP0G055_CLALP
MKLWISGILLALVFIVLASLQETDGSLQPLSQLDPQPNALASTKTPPCDCDLYRGKIFSNQEESIRCCTSVFESFTKTWHDESDYLTELLETLNIWNCSQFKSECANRTFGFNSFTDLVYERACDRKTFLSRCQESMQDICRGHEIEDTTSCTTILLRSLDLTEAELSDPCVQVGLYDAVTQERGSGFGFFHEMKRVFIPFCGIVWCGVDAKSVHERFVSAQICMNSGCKNNVIVVMAFCGALAVANVLMNLTVLAVMFRCKKLRCSQGIYRISLTFADLIAGAIIYPTFANNLSEITRSRESMGPAYNETQTLENQTYDSIPHLPGGNVWSHLDQPYLDFVGFFTSMYLTVTISTLLMASVDRFQYLRTSDRFSKERQQNIALISVACLWLVCVVFSIIPFFVDKYTLIASVMVLASGFSAIYIYLFAYLLPILIMWSVSMTTCCCSRMRRSQVAREGTEGPVRSKLVAELRKTCTLNIMIGVFTINLCVGCISAAASAFIPGIEFSDPFSLVEENAALLASLELVAIFFLVFNSLCNFPIYYIRDMDFRTECWKIVRICIACRGCKRTREPSLTFTQDFPDSYDLSSSFNKDLPGSVDVTKSHTSSI